MKFLVCFLVFFAVSCFAQDVVAPADDIIAPLCADMYCVETLIYSPICCIYPDGSSMTFGSYCSLQYYNCIHFTKCIAIAQGSCECLGLYQTPPIIIDPYPVPVEEAAEA